MTTEHEAAAPTPLELAEKLKRAAAIEAETGINIDVTTDDGCYVLTAADMEQAASLLTAQAQRIAEPVVSRRLRVSQSQPILPSNGQPEAKPSAAWRPIATAPKGPSLLLWNGLKPMIGHWVVYSGALDGGYWHPRILPTHWMPLPLPPSVAD